MVDQVRPFEFTIGHAAPMAVKLTCHPSKLGERLHRLAWPEVMTPKPANKATVRHKA
jgi:hypothetical protein